MRARRQIVAAIIVLVLLLASPLIVYSQSTNRSGTQFAGNAEAMGKLRDLTYVSPVYRAEVVQKIIEEANKVAHELRLSETVPITESNVTAEYIPPPKLAGALNALGNITTTNYTYYISAGNKFSYLVKTDLDKDYPMLREQFRWPISRMDTNFAYQFAIQSLSELSIDVHALTNACRTHITAMMVDAGQQFVPVYWVYWQRPEEEGRRNAALVELFQPTKTIRQLRVDDPQYILRTPITVTNVDFSPPTPIQPQAKGVSDWPAGLLSQHNPSDYSHVGTQLRRFKNAQASDLSDPYHAQVIRLLLAEINKLATTLNLPEKLPITRNDIVAVALTPPMAAKENKSLGSLSTVNYKYSFCSDDKFSALEPNFSKTTNDYQRLTTNYLWPISRQNTNAAFALATNFLALASVNVEALNHDCSIEVRKGVSS